MNARLILMLWMMALLLSACRRQTVIQSSPLQTELSIAPTVNQVNDLSPVEKVSDRGAASTTDKVVTILGDLLILSLYAFPMSYAINWAFGDPKKANKQPEQESPESNVTIETPGTDDPSSLDEWTRLSARLPHFTLLK